jgi:hypothetical protein
MNHFSRKYLIVSAASVIVLLLAAAYYLTFTSYPGMLFAETRVLEPAELKANGVAVEVARIGNESDRETIRVVIDDQPSSYPFEYVSIGVSDRKLNGNYLKELVGKNARPVIVRQELNRQRTNSFFVTKEELAKAFITVSYRRHRMLRLWGSDIRRYWIAVSDVDSSNQ